MMIKTLKQAGTNSRILSQESQDYQQESRNFLSSFPYLPSESPYNVTICHEKKFIWFRVAKVGTRTIFDVLNRADIKLDAEEPFNCHYPVKLYKNHFKFAFVRNPWDRLVSCWQNKVIKKNAFNFPEETYPQMKSFNNFVNFVAQVNINNCDNHFRLQSRLIDLNHIDYIGRFENFENDLKTVLTKLDIKDMTIDKKNATVDRKPYQEYYNEELKQRVARIYARDINLFSYKF